MNDNQNGYIKPTVKIWLLFVSLVIVVIGYFGISQYQKIKNFQIEAGIDLMKFATTTLDASPEQLKKSVQDKLLDMTLPKDPIKGVYFYSYGKVPTSTIEIMRLAVYEETGVSTTYMGGDQRDLPQIKGLYDEQRMQYDGDILWQNSLSQMQKAGKDVRAIYVFDADLYTTIGNDARPYIMSRAFPNQNAIVLSLYRLHNLSETASTPAPESVFEKRVKNLVLRSLGASIGLQTSSSAGDPSCIMSSANNLAELDQKTGHFCPDEAKYIAKSFLDTRK